MAGRRILIVGAGAVGTVYGHFLQMGGADVSVYVRPRHVDEVSGGLALYPLNALGRGLSGKVSRRPVRWVPDDVLSSPSEVEQAPDFEQIWLCVSATALRTGIVEELVAAIGEAQPTWVLWTPGLEDRRYLAEVVEDARIVQGVVTMISYAAPLEGSDERVSEPGVAFYLPPGTSQPLSGDRGRAQQVAAALVDGGCRAKVVHDASSAGAKGSAVMMPHLLGLEAASWSFVGLKSDAGLMRLASEAGREATAIVAADRGESTNGAGVSSLAAGFAARVMDTANKPWLLSLVLTLGPRLLPLDLEAYFRYHFTKVRDQTRYMVERYVALGEQQGRATEALRALLEMTASPPV